MSCFQRNGTADPDTYVKCEGSSMCCRTNDSAADECIDSGRLRGLCKGGPVLWREGCASSDWTSPECIPLCTEGEYYNGGDDLVNGTSSHVMITECGFDDSLCCGLGDEALACCDGKRGTKYWVEDFKVFTVRPGISTARNIKTATRTSTLSSTSTETISNGPSSTTSGETTSTTTTATSTGLNTSPSASQPSSNSSSSTPMGAIAGGIVGGIIGLVLLSTIVFLFLRRHARNRSSVSPHANTNNELQSEHRQELPNNARVLVELPTNNKGFSETRYHELDSITKTQ